MKKSIRAVLAAVALLASLACISGCAKMDDPYGDNDSENYTVCVKYDANGGEFGSGMSTYVITDSYDITEMAEDSEGNVNIPLLAPDDDQRAKINRHEAQRAGYFLAGWYAERNETGEKDDNGNAVYTYSGKWDFESDRLSLSKDGEYTSAKPQLTLYAAWVPLFETEFYSVITDEEDGEIGELELLDSGRFNPLNKDAEKIEMPQWSEKTGRLDMNDLPKKDGYTFAGAYYDKEFTKPIEIVDGMISHPGTLDTETAAATDTVFEVYLDWTEGEQYRIYTAEQFLKSISAEGIYDICADLDFEGLKWPTRSSDEIALCDFVGTINGNGYTMKNIEFTQTDNKLFNFGLFGSISDGAVIKDLTFENVTMKIQAGPRMPGACFGLLCGTLSDEAELSNVNILDSKVQIEARAKFDIDDYSLGLVCGSGDASSVSASVEAVAGEDAEGFEIALEGGLIRVTKAAN